MPAGKIRIARIGVNFEREPLIAPFGFKGGRLTELWQVAALIEGGSGCLGLGLGTQSVLWSDAAVFAENSESAANSLMFSLTSFALKQAQGSEFETPPELLEKLIPETLDYGRRVTGRNDLRLTFVLNALQAVDAAAWQLYALERKASSFDDIIPSSAIPSLCRRHGSLACIPLVTYGMPVEAVRGLAEEGHPLLKIKIGSDPEGDGDPDRMLRWDEERIAGIHEAVKDVTTSLTDSGRILYYLDANGRYDTKERLMRLIEHAESVGALERTLMIEEPFPEGSGIDVHDLPVRIAADESAHSQADVRSIIDLGYSAVALKPIAKTVSMSFRMAESAWKRGVPCFCADLTANPVLADWNRSFAARLQPLPGMKAGVIEINGHQNYRRWQKMKSHHPHPAPGWLEPVQGAIRLDEDFYTSDGCIFEKSPHYLLLVSP